MTGPETYRILYELCDSTIVFVTINDVPDRYRIEQDTIRSASEFMHMQCTSGFTEIELNLRGPQEALEILLYWIVRETLPLSDLKDLSTDNASRLLSQLWFVGSEYRMPVFQDEVMIELLKVMEHETASLEVIKYAFKKSKVGDPIRELMAEELAWSLREGELQYHELEAFHGIEGFISLLAETLETVEGFARLENGTQKYLKYMVGDGPEEI